MTVPFPKRETVKDPLWTGYFIMPHREKLNDLHGRTMVNIVSGETLHIYDKNSSRLPKPTGWLSLKTMEDEINHILSRAESKFCTPNGGVCTSRTVGLLARRHIVAGIFITWAKRHQRAGQAAPIRPCWPQRELSTRRTRLAASTKE